DFESGDDLNFQLTHTFEFLDDSFEISDGIDVLPGAYGNWEWQLRGRTASRRVVSLNGRVEGGGFWNGTRLGYEVGIDVRPRPGVTVGAEVERNEVTLPQGAFDTNLFRVEGAWDISPWSSVTGNVQYDNVSEIVGLFLRARWILAPGNDLFLVYTQNWQNLSVDPLDRRFSTLSRGGSTKLNYTFRF
ncbi:MAG: hydrolase, partial [Gemmatimonadetes bacterium]|nr:hydrolase [Gemmatimonadota bacterium]